MFERKKDRCEDKVCDLLLVDWVPIMSAQWVVLVAVEFCWTIFLGVKRSDGILK